MKQIKTIIGVDPGVKTGIAIYTNGTLVELMTIKPTEFSRVLLDEKPGLVVFEDSREQKAVWTAPRVRGSAKLAVARKVGMVDGFCYLIEAYLDEFGIRFEKVSPLNKGSKLKAKAFKLTTGHTGMTNEHERDAAMVARRFRFAKGL